MRLIQQANQRTRFWENPEQQTIFFQNEEILVQLYELYEIGQNYRCMNSIQLQPQTS